MSPSHTVGLEQYAREYVELVGIEMSPSHTVGLELVVHEIGHCYFKENDVSIPHGGLRTSSPWKLSLGLYFCLHPTRWA